jgi:hypothetical protein
VASNPKKLTMQQAGALLVVDFSVFRDLEIAGRRRPRFKSRLTIMRVGQPSEKL